MANICYQCFQYIPQEGVCPYCGYDPKVQEGKYPLALKPGSTLANRYVLGRVLGQGGFGITYLALDGETKSRVAIKEYLPTELAFRGEGTSLTIYTTDRGEAYEDGKKQFLEEAGTLSNFVGNEHIIRILNCFEENATAYFAMEYLEGDSLKRLLEKQGPMPVEEANRVLFPVMEALDWVHSKGIVHRDIAPDNILIRKDGVSKLIDFGAARYSTGEKSQSLDVILKHGFAPIEQYNRRGRQGPFTDVYAMAATYYYTITGKVPPDAIERFDHDGLIPPRELNVRIKHSTEQVLLKAMAVSAEDRYQTMAEFYRAMLATMPQPFSPEAAEETEEEKKVASKQDKSAQNRSAQDKSANAREKGKPAAKNRWIVPMLAVLLVGAALAAVFRTVLQPRRQYQEAQALLAAGEYEQAITILEKMPDYEDSEELMEEAEKEIAYAEAEDLFANGEYEAAIAAFEAMKEYKDSSEKITAAEDAMAEAANAAVYESAQEKLSAGQYAEAYTLFRSIPGYRDVDAILEENAHMAEQKAFREVGSTVFFGHYEQDRNTDNGPEEIEWIVLKVTDDQTMLLSKYALDSSAFHWHRGDATWETSDMRAWLNSTFLETAFDENERARILTKTVINGSSEAMSFHLDSGNNTEDRVFLLSQNEVSKLDVEQRACEPTAYAQKQGARLFDGYCVWWTRSKGDMEYYTSVVDYDGTFNAEASNSMDFFGVRPACWVDLTNGIRE